MSDTVYDIETGTELSDIVKPMNVSRGSDGIVRIKINPTQKPANQEDALKRRLAYLAEQGYPIAKRDERYSYFSDGKGLHFVRKSEYSSS